MASRRCPICDSVFEYADIRSHASFPFCSRRCALVDLGAWYNGDYAVGVEPDGSAEERSEVERWLDIRDSVDEAIDDG